MKNAIVFFGRWWGTNSVIFEHCILSKKGGKVSRYPLVTNQIVRNLTKHLIVEVSLCKNSQATK